MNLWLSILILTLVAALICFFPLLLKAKKSTSVKRDDLNKAFYFERLKELERDESQGLLENTEQLKL